MRRTAFTASILTLPVLLSGCTGFGTFLDHTFSLPGQNPNLPMTDSENVRRVLGQAPDPTPLQPEAGNVWPAPQGPDPTLADIQNNPAREDQRGQDGDPAQHQEREMNAVDHLARRGSVAILMARLSGRRRWGKSARLARP